MLEEGESDFGWEEDEDATIEQTISGVTGTEEARSSLRDLIDIFTNEEPIAAKPAPTAIQQTPTKSPATAPKVSSKRKGPLTSRGVIAPEEPSHK